MKAKTKHTTSWKARTAVRIAILFFMIGLSMPVSSQGPYVVTARFSNPSYDCDHYCVDVDFLSDTVGFKIISMNFRFFYPDNLLEFSHFTFFNNNYIPGMTTISTTMANLFNFVGPADFYNGEIFLNNPPGTEALDSVEWTTLFQLCFIIDDPNANMQDFCPSLVWDLEENPANGGFLSGDDGLVIVMKDFILNSLPIHAVENVVQFNWEYSGDGTPPYGMPVEDHCIVFDCPAPSNDDLCDAIPITVDADCNGFIYTTDDATSQPSEPSPPFCYTTLKSVWFSFEAPPSGVVRITTPNANNSLWMGRAVYTFLTDPPNCNNLGDLYLLACSSDQYEDELVVCGLAEGETYYVQVVTSTSPYEDNFCIEIDAEEIADAGPDQFLCNATSTTLEGNVPIFSEGLWTVISGTATITNPYSPTSGVTGLIPGTTVVLEWNVGYCPQETYKGGPAGLPDYATSDQVTITNYALPTTADAGFDRLTCDTFTNAIANTPVTGTGMWSVVSGTATLATPNLPTTNVTGLVHGTVVTLQWTITNGTCPASTDQMTISVLTDPDAGPDQQLCTDVNSTTLAANPVTVGEGFWSVISGMAMIDDYSDPNTSVTLTPGVPTALEWFIFFPPEGCDLRDTMMITWDDAPSASDAGPDQVLCNLTTTTLAGNTPLVGTGSWAVVSGTANITDPSSATSEVTGLIPGTSVVLEWTVTSGGCTPGTDEVTITVDELPTAADAGPSQFLCDQFSSTLAGNTPLVGTGLWTFNAGSATLSDPTSPTSDITDLVPGTYVELHWTISNGICPSSIDFVYIFDETPTATNAGMDQHLCNVTSTNLSADPLFCDDDNICETGFWTVMSGTANITDPSSPTSEITGLIPGTSVTLQWTLGVENDYFCAGTDEVTITIDALPTTADAGLDQSLCDQTSTILAANTPLVGSGQWTVNSGTATITDPSSPTSGVTGLVIGATAILQWTITNGICPVSMDQVSITVDEIPTISIAGPDQELCNQTTTMLAANTPLVGSGQWTVINGTANITNPDSPSSGVTGLIPGTSVILEWTISSGGCIPSTDEVMITVDELATVADAGPTQFLCEEYATTLDGNVPLTGTGVWTVTSGTATLADPSSPTSGVTGLNPPYSAAQLKWTITNGSCVSVDSTYIVVQAIPIANAGMDQQLCNVTSTMVSANPFECSDGNQGCETGMWSVISGVANLTTPTLPTTGVTGLVPGSSVILQWTLTADQMEPCVATDQVTITVDALPTPADAGLDQALCDQTSTMLAANTPIVGSGQWTVNSGTATITDPSSPTSGVTGLVNGVPAVLQWTISNGICPVSMDQVSITVDEMPTTSIAGPDQELCNQTTTMLAANTPLVGSGQWAVINGTANITNPSSPTSGVTGLVPGTTATLEWTITNGSCPASADQVSITSFALPTASNAGPDQQLCNQASTMLAANTPLVGSGQWTLISGTANITNPLSPTSGVTGLLTDASVVLQWNITNGICPASTDQVTITVSALPTISNAGSDQQLCNQTTTMLAANTPLVGSGQWTVINGTANITNPSSPTSGVTGLVPGTTATLAWTITNGSCPASVDQMSITSYALPTVSNAGPDQQLCNQASTMLAANTPVVGSGLWSVISGTANITNPASPTSGVTGLLSDATVVLQWTITNGTCPASTDLMTITNYALPTPSNAGPDKELCNQTTTTLSGNNPPIGNGQWSVISGTANITNPSSPVSGVTGLIPGTTVTMQWSITNGVCPASTDQMTITVYDLPTTANAGPDQQFCNQTTTTLAANNPSVGSGQWTVISGSATVTDPSSPTSGVTGLIPGISTTLQWKITNGTCPPSIDLMKIKVDELPGPADAGPDKFLCDQSSTVVNAEEPLIGNGTWSVVSGMATIVPPHLPTAAVLNLVNETTTTLQWAVSNGTCPANIDEINITVSEAPTEADAGPDQLVCHSTFTTLEANTPDVGVGYWLKLSGPGEITDPESPTSEITGLQSGVPTIVQWTIWNGYCQPSSDEVMLEVNDDVVTAEAGPDQLICGETTTTLAGNNPGNGSGFWSIVQGSATIADPNNPGTTLSDLIPGKTIVLEWTVTSGSCPPSIDQVSIFVDLSSGFADAGPDQVLCQQVTTMVEGNIPIGGSGQWTVISGTAEVIPADQPVAQVINLVPGSPVILQWTISNGTCPPDSDQVVIQIEAEPTIALAGIDQALCNETNALLSANTPLSGSGHWTVLIGQASIADPNSPSTSVSDLIPGTTAVLQWEITNAGCPPSTDQVLIHVDELPTTSDAGADQIFCDNSTTSLQANTPVIGQGSWTVLNGTASLTDPLSPTSLVDDLQPGQSATLQWTITNGVCPQSNDDMIIQVDHLPSPADAGTDQVLCGDIFTFLNATVPVYGQGIWNIVNGTATIVDPLSPVSGLTDLIQGTTVTLQWTVTNGTCPMTTDELIIEIKEAPTEADAGGDQALCEQNQSVLNANSPIVGTGQWEVISGAGMLTDVSQPTSAVTGLASNSSLILQWVTTYEGCNSMDTITISTYDTPSVANAGADQLICSTETVLNGNTPVLGTGNWTIVSGTGILSDMFNPSASITGLIPGTPVVLQWNITNGVCPMSVDEITIVVDTVAPIATAGVDQQLCGTSLTTVVASPPNIGTGTWTVVSGTAIIEDSLAQSTSVSGLLPGTTTVLRWTVSGNACPSAYDEVVITVDTLLVAADAGQDEAICSTTYMLSAEHPVVGTGAWSIISGIGSLQNQFDPLTVLTDVPEGTSISLEWRITNSTCPSVADTVTITSLFHPDVPIAEDDQVLCNSSDAVLKANHPDPGKGIGTWSLVSGAGVIENINDSVTHVTGLALGTNLFAWTISNGECPPLSDTVQIINNDGAELEANFLVSEFACTDDSVHMFDISGNATLPNGFFWDFGDNTTSTERDPIHVYTQQGDYTITMMTTLDGCGTASTSKVIRVFNCATNQPGNGGTRKVIYANVFPNPSDEDFRVSIKLREESEVNITLFDAAGRIAESRKIVDEKEISTIFEVEVPGLYFFRLQIGLEILIFKVVKVETMH